MPSSTYYRPHQTQRVVSFRSRKDTQCQHVCRCGTVFLGTTGHLCMILEGEGGKMLGGRQKKKRFACSKNFQMKIDGLGCWKGFNRLLAPHPKTRVEENRFDPISFSTHVETPGTSSPTCLHTLHTLCVPLGGVLRVLERQRNWLRQLNTFLIRNFERESAGKGSPVWRRHLFSTSSLQERERERDFRSASRMLS